MDTLLNAIGFAVLIGVFVVFRQVLINRRRRAIDHFHARMGAAATGYLVCPQCRNQVQSAAFCRVCGSALPPPLPIGGSSSGRLLLYVLMAIMGLIGLFLFFSVSSHSSRPHQATPQFGVPPSRW